MEVESSALDTVPARRRILTAEQERRRVSLIRFVAGVIGFGIAVFIFAIWRSQRSTSEELEAAPAGLGSAEDPSEAQRAEAPSEIPAPPEPQETPQDIELPSMAMPDAAPATPPQSRPVGAGQPPLPGARSGPEFVGPPLRDTGLDRTPEPSARPRSPSGKPPTASYPL
jgi:hypothetical protein